MGNRDLKEKPRPPATRVRASIAAMRLAFLVALLAVMALVSGAALAFLVAEYLEPPSAAQVTSP